MSTETISIMKTWSGKAGMIRIFYEEESMQAGGTFTMRWVSKVANRYVRMNGKRYKFLKISLEGKYIKSLIEEDLCEILSPNFRFPIARIAK
jgi:hypothetical protein